MNQSEHFSPNHMTITIPVFRGSVGGGAVPHTGHIMSNPMVVSHCCFCFGGETRFLTREGVRTLAETVGTTQWVLSADQNQRTSGRWVQAHIHEFGDQPLLQVTLRRNQQRKVILATSEHRWLVKQNIRVVSDRTRMGPLPGAPRGHRSETCSRGHEWTETNTRLKKNGDRSCRACAQEAKPVGASRSFDELMVTSDLRPGHRLSFLRQAGVESLVPNEDGIRHGIVFGDGSASGKRARVHLWGEKDKQLLPYFAEESHRDVVTPNGVPGVLVWRGRLMAWMKSVPSLDESDEYLYGWLAGYFAADGSVGKKGQVGLNSANLLHLEAVRDIATKLGIATYGITSQWRVGFPGRDPSLVHRVEFVGSTLNEAFFLTESHRDRYVFRNHAYERFGWTVEAVAETGLTETVYCAVVPGTNTFALEDNIWVGNCGSGDIVGGGDETVSCTFCNRSFLVMEQPKFNSMPVAPGATTDAVMPGTAPAVDPATGMPTDPAASGDPAAPAAPGAPKHAPTNPQTDPEALAAAPAFKLGSSRQFRTARGVSLTENDFVKHVAFLHDHEYMVGR